MLGSLVTDGTLTQAQADTIMQSIMHNGGMGRQGGGHGMGSKGEHRAPADTTSTTAVAQ